MDLNLQSADSKVICNVKKVVPCGLKGDKNIIKRQVYGKASILNLANSFGYYVRTSYVQVCSVPFETFSYVYVCTYVPLRKSNCIVFVVLSYSEYVCNLQVTRFAS